MLSRKKLLYTAEKIASLKTHSFLTELLSSQAGQYSNIRSVQWQRMKEVLYYSYHNSPFYRKVFSRNRLTPKDIRCPEDIALLPVLTREELIRHKLAIASSRKDIFIQSSGTSENTHVCTSMDFDCASKKYAIYLRHLVNSGWDQNTEILHFMPDAYKQRIVDKRHGFRQLFFTFVQNKLAHDFLTNREIIFYDSFGYHVDSQKQKDLFRRLRSSRNFILMGRVEFFVVLMERLHSCGLPAPQPRAIINIGVLLPSPLKSRLQSFFGCPVYDIYGSSEFSYIAGTWNGSDLLRINDETHFVEIEHARGKGNTDKSPGGIIVTDLLNYRMPLIRYRLGDAGYIAAESAEGIYGFRLLGVLGRLRNSVRLGEEKVIHEKELCDAVYCDEGVLSFHMTIHRHDAELKLTRGRIDVDEQGIKARLHSIGLGNVRVACTHSFQKHHPDKPRYVCIVEKDMSLCGQCCV